MTTCTKYPIGSTALWEGYGIVSDLIPFPIDFDTHLNLKDRSLGEICRIVEWYLYAKAVSSKKKGGDELLLHD